MIAALVPLLAAPSSSPCLPTGAQLDTFIQRGRATNDIQWLPSSCESDSSVSAQLLKAAVVPFFDGEMWMKGGVLQRNYMVADGPIDHDKYSPENPLTDPTAEALVEDILQTHGSSIVGRYETFENGSRRFHDMLALPDFSDSSHLYISGPSSSANPNHTDPYDVLVLGLHGAKQWRICSPSPATPFTTKTRIQQQCSMSVSLVPTLAVTPEDMETLSCRLEWLRAGDMLFMPAGTVHSATAGADGSAHVTFGVGTGKFETQAKRVLLCFIAKTIARVEPILPMLLCALGALVLRKRPMIAVGLVAAFAQSQGFL